METKAIIQEFKNRLHNLYGSRLRQILLYGSYARGQATEDSDIDIAVVLEGPVDPSEEIDRMADIYYELNLEHNTLLAVYPVSEKHLKEGSSPLLLNLRKEGVAV